MPSGTTALVAGVFAGSALIGNDAVVSGLPGVRQHGDKSIAFDGKGSLYVNVGAPLNACQSPDRRPKIPGRDPCPLLEKNAGIWKFDENRLGQRQEDGVRFAIGLRQMPAIARPDDALDIGTAPSLLSTDRGIGRRCRRRATT